MKPLPEGYKPLTPEQRERQEARLEQQRKDKELWLANRVPIEHTCGDRRLCPACKAEGRR